MASAQQGSLREPLLPQQAAPQGDAVHDRTLRLPPVLTGVNDERRERHYHTNSVVNQSLTGPVINLSCTIIGSGIIALPKSFQVLGIVLGTSVMLGVAILSYFSICGLIRASMRSHSHTYSSVIRCYFGERGSSLLRMTMILNCAGILTVYMVMIADILVGSEKDGFDGVLPTLFGNHEPGSLVTSRNNILGLVLIFVLLPIASMREMKSVAVTSAVGLCSVLFLVVSTMSLWGVGYTQGKLSTDWTWLPQLSSLGKDVSDALLAIVATIPVVMNAFICHQSVHPVMGQVRPLTMPRMNKVVLCSLTLCSVFYITTAGCAYTIFGSNTKSDVLQNFTLDAMANLVPSLLATFLGYSVRLVFSVALMMAFPLSHFTYRDNLCEVIWGLHAAELETPRFLALTVAGLLAFYCAACTLPNIWLPLSVIGSTAGVTVAFFFPSLLMLNMDNHNVWRQAIGAVLLAAGFCVSLAGLTSTLLPMLRA